ncbi:MAG TPA: SGNH/GDSL hydrolase family protein [bacterium]|nr:SGNH/GDSL hydrolase family protein [bacterium]
MNDPNTPVDRNTNQAENDIEISRGDQVLFHVVTLLLGLFIAFVALEAAFRVLGIFTPPIYQSSSVPGLEFELRPEAVFKIDGKQRRLNNMGFLDRDFRVEKADGGFRVVCLGDSMTNAISLPDGDSYVKLLEKKLGQTPPGVGTEFFNMGIGGYNTAQEWLVYEYKAKELNPDVVMVQFLLNDLTLPFSLDTGDRLLPRIKTFLSRRFHMYQFFKYLRVRLHGGFNASQTDFESMDPNESPISVEFMKPVYDPQGELFLKWKEAVSKFGELNRSGTNVLFVIFPWPIYQGLSENEPYPYYGFHNQVKRVLDEEGIPYIDVTPALTDRANLLDFWVRPTDFHLNSEAHKIIADVLEPEIKKILEEK